jgi:FlaA1/EpsC-like NDP-sugar epimerase
MHIRERYFILIDILLISLAYFLAFVIRFDLASYRSYYVQFGLFTLVLLVIRLPVFYAFGLYRRLWRYASIAELLAIVIAVSTGSGLALLAVLILANRLLPLPPLVGFPRSVIALEWLLTIAFVGGSRFAVRALGEGHWISWVRVSGIDFQPALIVGAGDAGAGLAREMQTSPHVRLIPVGFVDDDPLKHRRQVRGLPVLGSRQQLPAIAARTGARVAVIAMPTAAGHVIRETVELCRKAGLETRTIPGMYELLDGRVTARRVRTVQLDDLLRRESNIHPMALAADYLTDRRVLVTGAGGSIGSELCRQIMHYHPRRLILLGHGENSIYQVYKDLSDNFLRPVVEPIIADIRDRDRLDAVFNATQPEVVFHAAAHKHVGLMERNVLEAVSNNVFGTANVLAVCEAQATERFVLVSTDKAVRPINVMGATKRLAELLTLAAARRTGYAYVGVRFGNVLGSRGSVVPLFQRQIAAGGPVTVTHPQIRRFFMTIPEAGQLILRAGTLGQGSEIFVLDMGEQIRIVDLAHDLIRLSGLEVGQDIDIVFTGLQPGEKMQEELFFPNEKHEITSDEQIFVVRDSAEGPTADFAAGLLRLEAAVDQGEESRVLTALHELIPGFQRRAR